ncbi:MAG: hypothetical protein NT011_08610 [Kiritimatiellaeota bacterium]|nr:hypothetical protein [Kiritimatiellota bacterium]
MNSSVLGDLSCISAWHVLDVGKYAKNINGSGGFQFQSRISPARSLPVPSSPAPVLPSDMHPYTPPLDAPSCQLKADRSFVNYAANSFVYDNVEKRY